MRWINLGINIIGGATQKGGGTQEDAAPPVSTRRHAALTLRVEMARQRPALTRCFLLANVLGIDGTLTSQCPAMIHRRTKRSKKSQSPRATAEGPRRNHNT
jgi:hypothetical protein